MVHTANDLSLFNRHVTLKMSFFRCLFNRGREIKNVQSKLGETHFHLIRHETSFFFISSLSCHTRCYELLFKKIIHTHMCYKYPIDIICKQLIITYRTLIHSSSLDSHSQKEIHDFARQQWQCPPHSLI